VVAVRSKKKLGQWLEEAIQEKTIQKKSKEKERIRNKKRPDGDRSSGN